MTARLSIAPLLLGCAALAAHPAAGQPPVGIPPAKGAPRVHVDPGYHVGRVEYLSFRDRGADKDAELVSVGSDRSVRVWDLAPKVGNPRPKRAFYFPDIPSTASLNPNNGGSHLACGFYTRDGKLNPVVRIVDLNDAAPDGPVVHREAVIPDAISAVSGVHFDSRGDHLMITGGGGNLWQWSNWGNPKVQPKCVPIPPMQGHMMLAVAFQSKSQGVAVAGSPSKAAMDAKIAPAYLCVAHFDGQNVIPPRGKAETWRALSLPGRDPWVYSLEWHADYGLAVGYFAQGPNRLAHARVAVYPAKGIWIDEQNPIDVDLGVGFTSRVAWMPGGMLLATVAQDGFNSLPPEFLKVKDGKLVRVRRNDVFPGLDNHPVRHENGAGLSVCAAGRGTSPLTLAWAGYAQGTIELARINLPGAGPKHDLVSLDPHRRENWYTQLGWDDNKGEITLTGPNGRRTKVYDKILWKGTDLAKGLTAREASYNRDEASVSANPITCRSDLSAERELLCDPYRLFVKPKKEGAAEDGSLLFPGARSLLTFEKKGAHQPNTAVVLGSDGELTFWEHQPEARGPAVLERTATATLKGGKLEYHFSNGAASPANVEQRVFFARSGPDDTLARAYPQPGANDPQPAHIVWGLDNDVVLPRGKHTFRVRAPHAGTLDVWVKDGNGAPRPVSINLKVTAGDVTIPPYPFELGDCAVEVTLKPLVGNRAITTRHEIQVGKVGKVFLFDITPQDGVLCTELPKPTASTPRPHHPTAAALAAILENLTGGKVERHSAATRDKDGTHKATAAAAESRIKALVDTGAIGADDCFVLLLKGHGDMFPSRRPSRAIFKTDDFVEDTAEANKETGLTRDKLAELLGLVSAKTDKIVVILDCCKAEHFLDALHERPITFYPCCLRGKPTEATILPDALDRIRGRAGADFPGGLVTQGDFLRVIREECFGLARDTGDDWGYGAVRHRFILANRTR